MGLEIFIAIGGFIAGVIATVFSDAIASWIARVIPVHVTRALSAIAANPRLYFRMKRNTPERRVREVIETLFHAWQDKDLDRYLSCWADDAIRIVGINSNVEEKKDQIREKFVAACQRYSRIRVDSLIFERVDVSRLDSAIAEVRYRLCLERARDGLPVIEDAREVYALRSERDAWLLASNIDHFFVLGDRVAT